LLADAAPAMSLLIHIKALNRHAAMVAKAALRHDLMRALRIPILPIPMHTF
jgi:hypothetical protein